MVDGVRVYKDEREHVHSSMCLIKIHDPVNRE